MNQREYQYFKIGWLSLATKVLTGSVFWKARYPLLYIHDERFELNRNKVRDWVYDSTRSTNIANRHFPAIVCGKGAKAHQVTGYLTVYSTFWSDQDYSKASPPVSVGLPSLSISNATIVSMAWRHHGMLLFYSQSMKTSIGGCLEVAIQSNQYHILPIVAWL